MLGWGWAHRWASWHLSIHLRICLPLLHWAPHQVALLVAPWLWPPAFLPHCSLCPQAGLALPLGRGGCQAELGSECLTFFPLPCRSDGRRTLRWGSPRASCIPGGGACEAVRAGLGGGLGGGAWGNHLPPPAAHSVFWDLYCAAPDRREACEHSSEAKAFQDYVSPRPRGWDQGSWAWAGACALRGSSGQVGRAMGFDLRLWLLWGVLCSSTAPSSCGSP